MVGWAGGWEEGKVAASFVKKKKKKETLHIGNIIA